MTDARLVGTNPDTSELVPVAVNAQGQIKTEAAKIEEIPNDLLVSGDLTVTGTINGESGGGGISLPPNPQEGQVLGWENGQLAWIDPPESGGFFFYLDLLVVGGGGEGGSEYSNTFAGGGAGGMFHTTEGEVNPNGVPTPGSLQYFLNFAGSKFSIQAGGPAQPSSFISDDLSIVMSAGGTGGNQGDGASGGGGSGEPSNGAGPLPGGQGVEGQGSGGGTGGICPSPACTRPEYICDVTCVQIWKGGDGGGAGAPWQSEGDSTGLASSLTGTSVIYSVGGPGSSACSSAAINTKEGWGGYGSGGYKNTPAKQGVVYLKMPNFVEVEVISGSIQIEDTTMGENRLMKFTSGTAECRFKYASDVPIGRIFEHLQALADEGRNEATPYS